MKKVLFIGILLSNVSFASTIATTKISSILMGEAYGNVALIGISVKPGTVPACQTNPDYNYIIDLSTDVGKATLSLALTAYAAQKDVYLNGFDSCTLLPSVGVERLRQIWIK